MKPTLTVKSSNCAIVRAHRASALMSSATRPVPPLFMWLKGELTFRLQGQERSDQVEGKEDVIRDGKVSGSIDVLSKC